MVRMNYDDQTEIRIARQRVYHKLRLTNTLHPFHLYFEYLMLIHVSLDSFLTELCSNADDA